MFPISGVRKANFEEPSVQSEAEILSLIEEEKVRANHRGVGGYDTSANSSHLIPPF